MYGWLLKDIRFVWSETLTMQDNASLKLNNSTNIFLINLSVILYHAFSLNIYEYW